jgi:ribosomal protein L11 methyltransferase
MSMPEISDRVLDMGSGTGVLAIIAEKRGANEILAIDIEEGATENARSNVELNKCSKITALQGDIDLLKDEKPFGLILANINKNVLKAHMSEYARLLEPGGTLLLSGFFESDVDELVDFATKFGLQFVDVNTNDNWAMIQLKK